MLNILVNQTELSPEQCLSLDKIKMDPFIEVRGIAHILIHERCSNIQAVDNTDRSESREANNQELPELDFDISQVVGE